jgi:hypothetical protein
VCRSFSKVKQNWDFFTVLEIVTACVCYLPLIRRSQCSLAGTFDSKKIPLAENRFLQTGFFRHVRELKIQRKNPGSVLYV